MSVYRGVLHGARYEESLRKYTQFFLQPTRNRNNINASLAKFLQPLSKKYIEYKNQIFPKKPHIHLRACGAASSYRCPSIIVGSKITKWD